MANRDRMRYDVAFPSFDHFGAGPPLLARQIVGRSRLCSLFDATSEQILVIAAPAGYGKTCAVVDWLRRQPSVPVAWVPVDRHDSGPNMFWRHVIAAINGAVAGAGDEEPMLDHDVSSPRRMAEIALDFLGTRSAGGEMVLVFDDVDAITSEALSDELRHFLEHLPEWVQAVITARTAFGLPLARWRSELRAVVFGIEELRFRDDEARDLLATLDRPAGPASDVELLLQRSEGWAVGLLLGSSSGTDGPGEAAAGTSVVDYLVQEVLAGLDPADVDLLTAISVLDDFDEELAREVVGSGDAVQRLATLPLASLFVVPLPGSRFRFHALVGEALCGILGRRSSGDHVAELHRRAAGALGRRGERSRQLAHLTAAGDHRGAFELIVGESVELGYVAWAHEWLDQWSTAFVLDDVDRTVDYAAVLAQTGRLEQARTLLARARDLTASTGFDDRRRQRLDVRQAILLGAEGQLREALALGERIMVRGIDVTGDDRVVASLAPTMARICVALDDVEAVTYWVDATALTAVRSPVLLNYTRPAILAAQHVRRGDLREAERLATMVLTVTTELGIEPFPSRLEAVLAIHEVQLQQGRLAEARENLEIVKEMVGGYRVPTYEMIVAQDDASFAAAVAGPMAAAESLDAARVSLGIDAMSPDIGWQFDIASSRYLLLAGRHGRAAERWASVPEGPARALVEARASLRDDPRRVLALTADTSAWWVPQRLEGLLLRARVAGNGGGKWLAEALELAAAEGFVWAFVREGPAVVRAVLDRSRHRDRHAADIVDRLGGFADCYLPARSGHRVDALTGQERSVLRQLAHDLTGQEIAERLGISYNTLKTYRRSLYAKLGVTTRRDAIRRGRDLDQL